MLCKCRADSPVTDPLRQAPRTSLPCMIVPVVLCSTTSASASASVNAEAALAHAFELLSWFDTALLCVAAGPQARALGELLNTRQLSAHLLLTQAPCGNATELALAAVHLDQLGLDPLMLVASARLPLAQAPSLAFTVRQATTAAQAGGIVVVGVDAAQAGPFAAGARIRTRGPRHDGCHQVGGLDWEDPPRCEPGGASALLRGTGLYLAHASTWLRAFDRHAPAVAQAARDAMAQARQAAPLRPGLSIYHPDASRLATLPTHSLEHTLLQHLSDLAAITLHPPHGHGHPVNTRLC